MDAPLFFVHSDDAAAGFAGGSEMNVAHLGEGVSNGVVNGAFADFSTLDVGDGYAKGQSDGGWGEHFVAIGDQEKNVRTHLAEAVGKAERGDANGFGHTNVGIGTQETFDFRSDGETVVFDFAEGVAEFGREMRAEYDEFKIHFGMRGKIAERPVEMTVVGAGSGKDGDFAFQGFLRRATDSKAREEFRSVGIRERVW